MIYSSKHRFCVLANPKCASTSIQNYIVTNLPAQDYTHHNQTLGQLGGRENQAWKSPRYNHVAARYVKDYFSSTGEEWADYYSLITIRNPYSRMVSWYKWYLKIAKIPIDLRWRMRLMSDRSRFNFWLEKVFMKRIEDGHSFNPGLQYFAFDEAGNQLVADIVPSEKLIERWSSIISNLQLNNSGYKELSYKNVNNKGSIAYQSYYTLRSVEIVQNIFKKDIEIGSYEF